MVVNTLEAAGAAQAKLHSIFQTERKQPTEAHTAAKHLQPLYNRGSCVLVLRSMHRFKEGEVAIIKWQDKDCLVFIHRASFFHVVESIHEQEVTASHVGNENLVQNVVYTRPATSQVLKGLQGKGKKFITLEKCGSSSHLPVSSPKFRGIDSMAEDLSTKILVQNSPLSWVTSTNGDKFISIYWISFPGYRYSVAASFRWWTAENNLSKLIFDETRVEISNDHKNKMTSSIALPFKQDDRNQELWIMPNILRLKLLQQANDAMNGRFAAIPKLKRLNVDSIVEIFKKIVCAGAKLIEETEKYHQLKGCSQYNEEIDPAIVPPFKRFMKTFPTLMAGKISYADYVKHYVDNLPWIDLLIAWFNRYFLISGTHSKEESKYILDCLKAHPDLQLSQIMGIEHLVRCLQSRVIGKLWLDHLNIVHHEIFASFKVTTLFFLRFIAAVYNDFAGDQLYDEVT
ncbi:hypothetical protein IE077_002289 [Cardiosporidium cionae]|uniref:Uncharacterized protein n=1 Tax=Cardiosporidium cionae TaxID=476202 RepID=A0ABQ7JFT4_9APIC|nr:hypothetical protein IE077_002289 [Cardiosporidium cionae]|eukprot:KAF8822876.1 hypothetical protein IE077_002289 [Cardiosporidium cionae]